MHTSIDFPNLGIHLSSVRDHITIGGFDIAFYGLLIALAILVGVFITVREAERTGQDPEDYYDLAIFAVIFGVIGARLYYVIFDWDIYREDLKSIFNLREGGLAIYGGILAAALTVLVFARVKGLSAQPLGACRLLRGGLFHRTGHRALGQFLQPGGLRGIYGRAFCHADSGGRSEGTGYLGPYAGAY